MCVPVLVSNQACKDYDGLNLLYDYVITLASSSSALHIKKPYSRSKMAKMSKSTYSPQTARSWQYYYAGSSNRSKRRNNVNAYRFCLPFHFRLTGFSYILPKTYFTIQPA